MSRSLSAPDATTSVTQEQQAAKTKMLSVVTDPAKGVFSIMHSYFETLGKYLLFTKYLTNTNMPTAQQKKWAQNWSHTAQIRELYCIVKSLRLCNKLTATLK